MGAKSSEIVVGIDFGTTYSGVSWAVNGGKKTIRLINNWPDPSALNSSKDKVPSSISYVNGEPQKWGYTVGLSDESFKWIKILLEEHHEYVTTVEPVKNSNTLLRKVDKTAQAVVADYLRLLWRYTLDDIRKFHPHFQEIFALRVVLTVPAVWSHAAKDRTSQAARQAGLPEDITLVTEPEAAALATLKEKAEEQTLKVGDAFVVCDAGGGTVDLISYEVEDLNPLKLRECAIGSGALCGSVFLDLGFEKYIEILIGEKEYKSIRESSRKKMMTEFEYGIKRTFTGRNDQPYSVDLRGVKDDPANNIIDDTITITMSALRTVFDRVYGQIEHLVDNQIADVSDNGLSVKAILLVGGFGENRYLYDRLEKSRAQGGIQVLQVNGAWSSICRGATLWGLEHSKLTTTINDNPTITSRLSRYSYGIPMSEVYDSSKHIIQDRYFHKIKGIYMARNQMKWLLQRGDTVEEGRILQIGACHNVQVSMKDAWRGGKRGFESNLFYNDEPTPPTRKTLGVKFLCKLKFEAECSGLWVEQSFKSAITKEKYRTATFQVSITPRSAALEFVVHYQGKELARVHADYAENLRDTEVESQGLSVA